MTGSRRVSLIPLSSVFCAYLSNVPCFDVLQLQEQLLVAASLQLLYECSAVSRLRGEAHTALNTRMRETYAPTSRGCMT